MAGKDGLVDVIVYLPTDHNVKDPVRAVIDKVTNGTSSKEQFASASDKSKRQLIDELQNHAKKGFKISLLGFGARLSPSSLDTLRALDPTIGLYPDFTVQASASQNIVQIGADQVWSRTDTVGSSVTGKGIVVAIIDTGVDYNHPDLGGGIGSQYKVIGGYDFYNEDNDPIDDNGHGTHVAGIIAGNGVNFKGVAPDAKILAYKALGPYGSGSISQVIAALEMAIDPNGDGDTADHADVVSMSLGGSGDETDPICLAVNNAVAAGVVVVVAAGNDGPAMGTVASPGVSHEAITVGAIDSQGSLASFSSRGTGSRLEIKPDVSAPGVAITSTVPYSGARYSSTTGYMEMSGTSMATPHVSGAAALLLQMHPDWTPQMVKSALLTSAKPLAASLWWAGAGGLWAPSAVDARVFVSEPLLSYGLASGDVCSVTISNSGVASSFSMAASDSYSLSADAADVQDRRTDLSTVTPTSVSLNKGGSQVLVLDVTASGTDVTEGYYEGEISVRYGTDYLPIRFGFAVLSRLSVHVLDLNGNEIYDRTGVWVYSVPDALTSFIVRDPSAPTAVTFLLPSGNYSVHAAGHRMLYFYDSPYLLSGSVYLNRLEDRQLYLRMSEAKQMTLDLATDSDHPIYVKVFRIYCSYAGIENLSFEMQSVENSMYDKDILTLPKSKCIFLSETGSEVGISVTGFSFSNDMWDFVEHNWKYWYQTPVLTTKNFLIESIADLQYLLAWEFEGINASTPTSLTLTEGKYSVYNTKYDIPGSIVNVLGTWGNTLSLGGTATLYMRKYTDTPISTFFSGLSRKTIVQGVFSELYYPGDLREGYVERQFYVPDYGHTKTADSSYNILLPDLDYITPYEGVSETDAVGRGPYYPSVRTSNSNTTITLMQPLLRDQSGARIIGPLFPEFRMYYSGVPLEDADVIEYMARPDAERLVLSATPGSYLVEYEYPTFAQICNDTSITLGFTIPSVDVNPPVITGLSMPQRFIPGNPVSMRLLAVDDHTLGRVQISWRPSEAVAWRGLVVTSPGAGEYEAMIQTSPSDDSINLRLSVQDSVGNYVEYTAANASLCQIPVSFDLSAGPVEMPYKDFDTSIQLAGHLTLLDGTPLHPSAAVPIELVLDGRKVAIILDEYIEGTSVRHDGSIRYEWHINPTELFSGPNEIISVQAIFDIGTYEPVTRTIQLKSLEYVNPVPVISLVSPANGSLVSAGQIISIKITDDGMFSAYSNLDGNYYGSLTSPWQISTASWIDGRHVLEIVATDVEKATSRSSFEFEVDALAPSINITYPRDGTRVPTGSVLRAEVVDAHISQVFCSVDGGPQQPLNDPYSIDMTGWAQGRHVVTITASDQVGRSSSRSVSFEIAPSTLVLTLDSPSNGAVIRSGALVSFTAMGSGSITYRWHELGAWHELGTQHSIVTVGWSQGTHNLLINATNDFGGWDEIPVVVTIDDVTPAILLQSPANNTFVSPSDQITIKISDDNVKAVVWILWGILHTTAATSISIPLSSPPGDGGFTLYVTATDKAGNGAKAEFSFAMDSTPPSLLVGNLASGDAVRPGFVLNVSASDAYLSLVRWALDNGQSQVLATPYRIDTLQMALGWHTLQLVAKDASGKQTTLNMSLYLDDAAPVVGELSPRNYVVGSDLAVTVRIADDFKVGGATLYYELRDGQYANVRMNPDNGSFAAVLPASVLWDGMKVYVVGVDAAGNIAESSRTDLRAAIAPSGSGGIGPIWNLLGSVGGIVLISSVALISSISFFFVAQRRNKDDEKTAEPKGGRASPQRIVSASLVASTLPAMRKAREVGSKSIGGSSRPVAQVNASAQRSKSSIPVFEAKKEQKTPSLLDSIPEILVKSQVSGKDSDLEADYGAMIERELIIPSLKKSIFKDVNVEIDRQLAELVSFCEESRRKTVPMPRP